MVLLAIVRVPLLDTPPPVLPEMVLFLTLSVPPFDKAAEGRSSAQSHILKRQIPRAGVRRKDVALTAMRPKAGASPWRAIVAPLPSIVI